MLSRIFIAILLVMAWVLISRLIRALLSQGSRGPDGSTEIPAAWEVIRPLGQIDAKHLQKLGDMLGVEDGIGLRRIATVLEVVHRTIHGPEMDRAEVRRLVSEPDDELRARLFGDDRVDIHGWLVLAAGMLCDQRPEFTDYEARREIHAAFHTVFPSTQKMYFQPEPRMSKVPEAPAPPGIDPRFMHFFDIEKDYYEDPTYKTLCSLDPEDLPDGAMLPLLHLVYINDMAQRKRGPRGVTPIEELLARYKERLYPAIIEYLCYPERYEPSLDTVYEGLIFEIIGRWSQTHAEPLFYAAFESGWNDCTRWLPHEPWAEDLVAAFDDSPYGPPRLPRI